VTLLDVVVVALIQGLAEVLPLGASGHLALLPASLAGVAEDRAAVLLAAHGGIVLALALYFWRDLLSMGVGLWKLVKGRPDNGTRLFFRLLVGTVPVALAGWAIGHIELPQTGVGTAAAALLVFGGALLVADKIGMTVRRIDHLSFTGAFIIGALQVVALIPGVSRTGITVTAARVMGFERVEAARFSLLLALPLMCGSAANSAWALWQQEALTVSSDLVTTTVLAALAALIATAAMIAWIRRNSYAPFAVWRIVLGAGALAWMALG